MANIIWRTADGEYHVARVQEEQENLYVIPDERGGMTAVSKTDVITERVVWKRGGKPDYGVIVESIDGLNRTLMEDGSEITIEEYEIIGTVEPAKGWRYTIAESCPALLLGICVMEKAIECLKERME